MVCKDRAVLGSPSQIGVQDPKWLRTWFAAGKATKLCPRSVASYHQKEHEKDLEGKKRCTFTPEKSVNAEENLDGKSYH